MVTPPSHREVIQMTSLDSFMVFDRTKEIFDYPIHFHPEIELNYISNGGGLRRVVGDSMEEIGDKELVLIGPNISHCWEQYHCSGKKIHEITIQFREDLFQEGLLKRAIMKPLKDMLQKSVHGIAFSEASCLLVEDRLREVAKLDGIDYFIEMLSILYDLATSRNQRLLTTPKIPQEKQSTSEKMNGLFDFIQMNYSRKIPLSEVSDFINMSPVSFNRFIKKRTGKTFVEYLNEVRVGYASRWLVEKDESISQIAYSCGFNNIANFNRIFKRIKGCTPSEYKQEFLGIKRVL